MNETVQTLKTRGQELVAEGNQRSLVFRNKNGQEYFQTSLTIATAVTVFLLLTGFLSIPVVLIGGAIATVAGVRVDLVNSQQTVEVEA